MAASAPMLHHASPSRAWARWSGLALFLVVGLLAVRAAEVIPPAPRYYFNDAAGLVTRETAARLERELAQFERDTSNQLVVAIYPRMQSDSSIEDYTVRVAQSWAVGQKDRKNGAVLFVFQESRAVWIATGYGLEGALPDALCKRIIEQEIVPRFRAGDFDGGLTAGARAMMAAARDEYRGSGQIAAEAQTQSSGGGAFVFFLVLMILVATLQSRARRNTVLGRRGRTTRWMGGPPFGGGGWGGGSWGGGGGGGGFSGGGGSFGGGGAGGRW